MIENSVGGGDQWHVASSEAALKGEKQHARDGGDERAKGPVEVLLG